MGNNYWKLLDDWEIFEYLGDDLEPIVIFKIFILKYL